MGDTRFNKEYYDEYHAYLTRLAGDNSASRKRLIVNLRRAIREEITDKEWEALQMYYVQQLKMADIAARLNVNISTVSRNIKRGRNKLNRCLRYGAKELLYND